jgi:L-proline amide hydrolase
MLGAEFAVTRPAGLKGLVIANSPASMELWISEANRLRDALPPEVQATLLAHEAAGTTDSREYADAVKVFYERHVCRVVPMPDEVARSLQASEEDPTVYHTMNGPSEYNVIGTLKTWSIIDRLAAINVPTWISGRHDEATPATVSLMPTRSRRVGISSRTPVTCHMEEAAACLRSSAIFEDADGARPANGRKPRQ